jgi:hypothetical protein
VAAVYTSEGGGMDCSRVVAHRSPPLSGATVATILSAVRDSREMIVELRQRGVSTNRGTEREEGLKTPVKG